MNNESMLKIVPKDYLKIFTSMELGRIYKSPIWKTELFGL